MTDKPIPMTREEEYRNADVPMPKDNQLLIAEIDRLRSQIERLKNLITNA